MRIIGITGTIGAGKGTVVEYLQKHGFEHFSARNVLIDILNQRGLPLTRDNMRPLANELRETYGPAHLIELLYQKALSSGKDAVIESVRTLGEVAALKKHKNFQLRAVDADVHIRYKRITLRKSSTDNVTFEEFVEAENKEMDNTDPTKGNITACIKAADSLIINEGTTEELNNTVQKLLQS